MKKFLALIVGWFVALYLSTVFILGCSHLSIGNNSWIIDDETYSMPLRWNTEIVKSWVISESNNNYIFTTNYLEVAVWRSTYGMMVFVEYRIDKINESFYPKSGKQRFHVTLYDKYGNVVDSVIVLIKIHKGATRGIKHFFSSGRYTFDQIDSVGVVQMKSVWGRL